MAEKLEGLLGCLPRGPEYRWDWTGLESVAPLYEWMRWMEGTPQNPLWHGEGDVWTHTKLVCEALAALDDFRTMPPRSRDALALAALLHDIGKVNTTRL